MGGFLFPHIPVEKRSPQMTTPLLRFENLAKRHGDHVIFEGLHYMSDAGCVALSDDMVGKSTLLDILGGALKADVGNVWINGNVSPATPDKIARVLAYIPDDCMLFPQKTGRAFLEEVASCRETAIDDATLAIADRFDLSGHLDKRFEQLSRGARKKMFLTGACLGTPSVIIADEPSGGLDAPGRSVLVDLFTTLAKDRLVFFASYDPALKSACHPKIVSFADFGMGI
jgi:heme-transporting ATPase